MILKGGVVMASDIGSCTPHIMVCLGHRVQEENKKPTGIGVPHGLGGKHTKAVNHWRGFNRFGTVVRASLCRLTYLLQGECSLFAGEFQYCPLHPLMERSLCLVRTRSLYTHICGTDWVSGSE